MDALTRLSPIATELLSTVDDVLARFGAPADHVVWGLLRETRVLPSEAVAALAGWQAEPWLEQAAALRRTGAGWEASAEALARVSTWEGRAGAAFSARLTESQQDLATLREQAELTAAYLEDLAAWLTRSRTDLARALARVVSCAQAVTVLSTGPLSTGLLPSTRASAAADVAAVVLRALTVIHREGEAVSARYSTRLTLWKTSDRTHVTADTALRVEL